MRCGGEVGEGGARPVTVLDLARMRALVGDEALRVAR